MLNDTEEGRVNYLSGIGDEIVINSRWLASAIQRFISVHLDSDVYKRVEGLTPREDSAVSQ